jgi:ferredoxin--NADP+ reductase
MEGKRIYRMSEIAKNTVAVIGAGPAGLFAARELATNGIQVVLFNRDIKPGGLAEYGIYPSKHKMKEGLRAQFRQTLAQAGITYFGNITIGNHGDLCLGDLRDFGFQAILVTVGAQGTKWLGLPGEELIGVYHAKNLVYHYNHLPPFSEQDFHIGKRVAVVGAGNVMGDISHYMISEAKVDELYAIVRRGPAEVKFDKKELELFEANLDLSDLNAEIDRVSPMMVAIGQDPAAAKNLFHTVFEHAQPTGSDTHFTMQFLGTTQRILGNDQGYMTGLVIEDNTLVLQNGEVKARSLGTTHTLNCDTVIFAIGDQVSGDLGLPVVGPEFYKNPQPRFPTDGNSYESCDPNGESAYTDTFVAGWARKASTGLVGIARKDGTNGARAVMQFLATLPANSASPLDKVVEAVGKLNKPVVTQTDLARLESAEKTQAERLGLVEFKFSNNEEMLEAMGLQPALP